MRYSLDPFFALTGWTMTRVREVAPCGGDEWRRRRVDGVTELIADRLAVAAGLHPAEVWPEWMDFDDNCVGYKDDDRPGHEDAYRECARASCSEMFLPCRTIQRYCSPVCRKREENRRWQQRRYHRDEAFKGKLLARNKRWYEECHEYALGAQRRRDRAKKKMVNRAKNPAPTSVDTRPAPSPRPVDPQSPRGEVA